MTYKQFMQELEDDILPAEAERRYVLNVILISLINCMSFVLFSFVELHFFISDIKNTSQSILQHRNKPFLILTRMKNGTCLLHLNFPSFCYLP